MKTNLYCDTVTDLPLLQVEPERLSDGSEVWNLSWCQHVIPCTSEKSARKAFDAIAKALEECTSENVVID